MTKQVRHNSFPVEPEHLICNDELLSFWGKPMAYECPNCRTNTLSTRPVDVKVCLNCGKITGKEDLLNLLRKVGVSNKTIKNVDSDLS